MKNKIEVAREKLHEAETVRDRTAEALRTRETNERCMINSIRGELNNSKIDLEDLKKDLLAAMNADDQAGIERIENNIDSTKKEIARLEFREEAARESSQTDELVTLRSEAYEAGETYRFAYYALEAELKQAVLDGRKNYFEAMETYWAEAEKAADRQITFARFPWKNLEIDAKAILKHTGPIHW